MLHYDTAQLPAGAVESRLAVAYWDKEGSKWATVENSQVNTITHTVSAPITHFSIYSLMIPQLKPAAFNVSQLAISPTDLRVGQTGTISVQVYNVGEAAGDYEVSLEVAGKVIETKHINVEGWSIQTVAFNLMQDQPGTYDVVINGLRGTIRVLPLMPVLLKGT